MTTAPGRSRWLGIGLPVVAAYLPLLLTQRGQVGADTKTYLYLDPARLLSRAPYLWDEHIGAGTITHQNIGYLWPMGPWYWLWEQVGAPDWVAQRLWLGTVMVAAALGVRFLLAELGWQDGPGDHGVLVASMAYMLSPYLLDYSARISVILLPWAGLPWLVALTSRSLRAGGWRWPAWFALVTLTVGGINATALVMVAPAVALWVVHAWLATREVTGRQALAGLARMGVLTLATSLWWMAGLWAQGRYGLPVLRFTETYRTVAESSSAPEVLRGLGYWFFYGRDKLGPWIEPSVEYTNRTALLALSYLLPTLALAAAALLRWRHRAYFLILAGAGGLLAVAAHPWHPSSPLGAVFKVTTRTDTGLALRSTPRAVPLVVLATSVFLGAGVRALGVRRPRLSGPVTAVTLLLVVVNLPPLWNGTMIANNLKRPEHLPGYWEEAATWLEARGHDTRVLEVPGSDFASYRWGNTVDPITPGLIDRPYLARELFQYGTPATAALLIALDRPLHEDTLEPDALAPVARLLAVGDLVHRGDLQYERFRTARPLDLARSLDEATGLADPVGFGAPRPNVAGPEQPLLDEITLTRDPEARDPAPVTVYPVEDPLPIVRARSAAQPLVLVGGPDGVVDAAGAGLLQDDQALFYGPSLVTDAALADRALGAGADLLVTDTNRRRAQRWGTTQQNTGYTERSGEEPPAYDPTDQRLDVFPGADAALSTTSEQHGGIEVSATDYGNPVTFTPDDRPANAVDGDITTAWRVGSFSDVTGEALTLRFTRPRSADRVTVVQPVVGIVNRYITDAELVFDGTDRVPVTLDATSQALPGQTLTFAPRTFSELRIEIRDTDVGRLRRYDGFSGVGLAEVAVGSDDLTGGPKVQELIRLPDLASVVDTGTTLDHRLGYLFTRLRANPREKVRADEEPWLARVFDLPGGRSFGLDSVARLSALTPDEEIDAMVGLPGAQEGGITATSDARIPGGVAQRASATLDGDLTTAWVPPFEDQAGHYLEFTLPAETTLDQLQLSVVADGRHSVPTVAFLRADGDDTQVRELRLGDISDGSRPGAVTTVDVSFPPLTGTTFRLAIDQVREEETVDWHSGFDIVLPIAIAEVDLPGAPLPSPALRYDSGCRTDLLAVDDRPVPLRVEGTTEDLLARRPLEVAPCAPTPADPAADPWSATSLTLDAGDHRLVSTPGRTSGLDLDRVVLTSDRDGEALAPTAWTDLAPRVTPTATVRDDGPVGVTVEIGALSEPAWLVLGQSHSPGWSATVSGRSLGSPVLIDGYANGWYLDPEVLGSGPVTVTLAWTPQRVVWAGIALSGAGVVACVGLVLTGLRRRARYRIPSVAPPAPGPLLPAAPGPWLPWGSAVGLGLIGTVASFLFLPWPGLAAPLVGAITVTALRWRRGRRLPATVATGLLAFTGAFYAVSQYRFRFPPDFAWPKEFSAVDVVGVVVLLCLTLEGLIHLGAQARHQTPPGPGPGVASG